MITLNNMTEPKFNIGDEAFVMQNNCVRKIKISGMVQRIGGGYVYTDTTVNWALGLEGDATIFNWYIQERVFVTKELLLAAL